MADTWQGRHISEREGLGNTQPHQSHRLTDSDLKLCTAYLYKKDGCSRGDDCNFLHVCRYFMLRCCRGGKDCKFSHDLSTRASQDWFQRRCGIRRMEGENLHKFRELFGETLRNPPKSMAGDESFKATWEEKRQRSLHSLRQFLISLSDAEGTSSRATAKDIDGDLSKSTRAKSSNETKSTQQRDDKIKTSGGRKVRGAQSSKPPQPEAKTLQEDEAAATISQSSRHLPERCPIICLYYLRGTCSSTEAKHKDYRHFPNTFQWQIKDGERGIWLDLTEETNLKVEQHYCDVTNGEYNGGLLAYYGENKENILHLRTVTITFGVDTLTISDKSGLVDVRRLSSMSYAQAGGWIKAYSTLWTWYWQNDRNNWIEYPHKNAKEGSPTPSTKNETIEMKYVKFKYKGGPSKMTLTTDQGNWCLDFASMEQTSSRPGAVEFLPVARRPKWKPSPKQQPPDSSGNSVAESSSVSSPAGPVKSAPQPNEPVTLPATAAKPIKKDAPAPQMKEPAKEDVSTTKEQCKLYSSIPDVPASSDSKELPKPQRDELLEIAVKIHELRMQQLNKFQEEFHVRSTAAATIPKQTSFSKLVHQAKESQRSDPACQTPPVKPSGLTETLPSSSASKAVTKDRGAPKSLNQNQCLDICTHFLKGSCKMKDDNCNHGRHLPTPYQWQYLVKGTSSVWEDYHSSSNDDFEKSFCDVTKDAFTQSVPAGCSQKAHFIEWMWYWQDERDQWIAYSDMNAKGDRAGINSAVIEKKFKAYNSGGESFVEFVAGQQKYKLDFATMLQTNLHFGTCRQVKRKPKPVLKEDYQKFPSNKWLEYQHSCLIGGTLRRLSTTSSVLVKNWERAFSTEWIWYWQDELGNWIPYSEKNHKGDRAGINSTTIEKKFLDYVDNQGESVIEFTAGQQKYKLDFAAMQQTNVKYGTCRKIRHRPKFVPMAERQKLSSQLIKAEQHAEQLGISFPVTWENVWAQKDLELVLLDDKGSQEYTDIATLFENTMSDRASILSIRRVQNMELWEDFTRLSERMKKKNGGVPVCQKRLFHGTPARDKAHAICRQNFDWRLNGSNVGTIFGKGSYFALDADLAHRYTKVNEHGHRYVLVAQVLVGAYTTGSPDYARPPPKDPSRPHGDMYDSCVDSISNPKRFVIFEKMQAYPEYLIKYKDKSARSLFGF